jgi:uncharacterized protein YutE (UPF0331/DUF86 family)
MVNENLLVAKLTELSDRIQRARAHCPPTVQELADDRDALDLVSFNLMLAVQTCADIAAHIVSDEGWPTAKSLAIGFERLVEHGVTSAATAEQLKRAVGLRNVVAHGYARINVAMVHEAATRGTDDLERYAADIGRFVTAAAARAP